MDPQIAAGVLGTLIQSAMTFLAVYFAIIIFILQDKILAPFFLGRWQVWFAFVSSCFLWILEIALLVKDFMSVELDVQFSSSQIVHDVWFFFAALSLSFLTFILILLDRIRLGKEEKKRT